VVGPGERAGTGLLNQAIRQVVVCQSNLVAFDQASLDDGNSLFRWSGIVTNMGETYNRNVPGYGLDRRTGASLYAARSLINAP